MAFSVSWDAYQNNICNGLSVLQQNGRFVDMTIAADGHHVKAHQMVLSLVSPYIGDLITSAACPHPVIFLNQVSYQTLESILQYAYTGEVLVAREKISDFLQACKALHIRGVEDLSNTGYTEPELESNNSEQLIEPAQNIENPPGKMRKKDVLTSTIEKYDETTSDNDTMDSSYEMDHTTYHCGGSSPLPVETKTTGKAISDNLQFTVSLKGSLQLVCNRYLYFLMSSRLSGERMWRCMSYKKRKGSVSCRAFLVTKENKIIRRVGAHSHPFHDSQILKRMNKGNMFSAINEVETRMDSMKNTPSASNETTSNAASVIITQNKRGGHSSLPQLT